MTENEFRTTIANFCEQNNLKWRISSNIQEPKCEVTFFSGITFYKETFYLETLEIIDTNALAAWLDRGPAKEAIYCAEYKYVVDRILKPVSEGGLTNSQVQQIFGTSFAADIIVSNTTYSLVKKYRTWLNDINKFDQVKITSSNETGIVVDIYNDNFHVLLPNGVHVYKRNALEKTGTTFESAITKAFEQGD